MSLSDEECASAVTPHSQRLWKMTICCPLVHVRRGYFSSVVMEYIAVSVFYLCEIRAKVALMNALLVPVLARPPSTTVLALYPKVPN